MPKPWPRLRNDAAKDRTEAYSGLEAARSDFETEEAIESIEIETDFQIAEADASLEFTFDSIEAWVTYALAEDHEAAQPQYEADMEQAAEDYNETMKEAWDTLRNARAENIGQRAAFDITPPGIIARRISGPKSGSSACALKSSSPWPPPSGSKRSSWPLPLAMPIWPTVRRWPLQPRLMTTW